MAEHECSPVALGTSGWICGCGKPVTAAAVPDPRFRDQLAVEQKRHRFGWVQQNQTWKARCDCKGWEEWVTNTALATDIHRRWQLHAADALMPTIAAEVEARVQAAEIQQDDELDELMREPNAERAELVRLARKYDLDNHHNAALCPYCSPRVQATANQRAAEELEAAAGAWHPTVELPPVWKTYLRARAAALASPAPAPHAEEK